MDRNELYDYLLETYGAMKFRNSTKGTQVKCKRCGESHTTLYKDKKYGGYLCKDCKLLTPIEEEAILANEEEETT